MFKGIFKGKGASNRLSVESAIRRLFSAYEFQALLAQTPDRRCLVENAAFRLGASEESLIATLGELMDVAVVWNILPVTFCDLVGAPTIDSFYQAGAYPIVANGRVVGIVAADPLRALTALNMGPSSTLKLSSWSRIKEALREAELTLEMLSEKRRESERERLLNTAETVIGLVIEEAESCGAQGLSLEFKEKEIEYIFESESKKPAIGGIDRRIKDPLEQILRRSLENKTTSFRLSDGGFRHDVKVSILNDLPLKLKLCWAELKEEQRKEISNLIPFPGKQTISEPDTSERRIDIPVLEAPSKVLIIDDNETFAKVLERFLSRYKIETEWKSDAERAFIDLETAKELPGAIVCDVHMPSMNGFEFLSKLKTCERLKEIPIVMLTSDQDIETELGVLSLGADVFIGKTEDPRLLCLHVKRLLERGGKREAA